ncbi:MAG: serine hydrolase domain-containing protein [Pseudomonadota bacterium]
MLLKKKYYLSMACVISIFFTVQLMANQTTEEITAWTDNFIKETLTLEKAAGVSILVAKGDEIIFCKAYGHSDIENNVAAKINTVYEIGSLTKQFTSVAIMQLIEQGKLSLSDDITKYIPDFPSKGKNITLANILYHTSGIKNYIQAGFADSKMAPGKLVNNAEYRLDLRPEEMRKFFENEPLDFEPGTSWSYSNSGYFLAGLIIEKVSGMSYEDYIESKLFTTLSMTASSYTNFEDIVPNRAHGYKVKNGKLLNADLMDMSVPYSAGALSSTLADLFKWNRTLHKTNVLLNKESYKTLITPGKLNNGSLVPINYALGIASPIRDGHKSILHPGSISGFSSIASYFPEEDITVIVLSNTSPNMSAGFADMVELALSAFLYGSDKTKFSFM